MNLKTRLLHVFLITSCLLFLVSCDQASPPTVESDVEPTVEPAKPDPTTDAATAVNQIADRCYALRLE